MSLPEPIHEMLHKLWTRDVGRGGYARAAWIEFEARLERATARHDRLLDHVLDLQDQLGARDRTIRELVQSNAKLADRLREAGLSTKTEG